MMFDLKKTFITGGAGFIGSNLADRLLEEGATVVSYDNFSTGFDKNLEQARTNSKFKLIQGDLLDLPALTAAMAGCDFVFHLAANADVRHGTLHPGKDLEQNTIGTFNVLEAMRANGIKNIVFSSTGSVYGEATVIPTPENYSFPIQTSLYGASKLSGEALIEAYCEGFGCQGYIFRFVSILGERYSHGHVFDFYKQLTDDPTQLYVLGNGKQRKSYLYVQDCLDAMFTAIRKASDKINIFNLGVDDYCEVTDSIGWICETLGVEPKLYFKGGDRGWIGDNPFIFLDTTKIRDLGWQPKFSIKAGVVKTVEYLRANKWVMKDRK